MTNGVRALVTGAAGFVGRHLTAGLRAGKAEALGLGRKSGSGDAHYVRCDILDFQKLQQTVSEFRPQQVYHLAALTHPKTSWERARDYYEVNVQGTINVLETVRHLEQSCRMLLVSSAEVYGENPPGVPRLREDAPLKPRNPYAVSKSLAEQAALAYHRHYGVETVIARPFNHTGPGQLPGFVIPDFCRKVRADGDSIEVGNLSSERDFLDVRDVMEAYRALMHQGSAGAAYNICSGRAVSIRALLDLVQRAAGTSKTVEAAGDTGTRLVGDHTKLAVRTGWKPHFTLQQTIESMLTG